MDKAEKQIWLAYGENYAKIFQAKLNSSEPNARETTTEIGKRALSYFVQAEAFDKLNDFTSSLITRTRNPQQLKAIIAELQKAITQVPAGETHWSICAYLADALWHSDQSEQAVYWYTQAIKEAESAQSWLDVAWIYHNFANALINIGQLVLARAAYQLASQAYNKTNSPKIYAIACEIETLKLDVKQKQVEEVLPKIEHWLTQIRDCWKCHERGETVVAAPDAEFLARVFLATLDIAEDAHRALRHWQTCLDLLNEIEKLEQRRGESEHILVRTRFNQYKPLVELGKVSEAKKILEECLQVDSKVGDLMGQVKDLNALADVWNSQGDLCVAIEIQRQSLKICENLDVPEDRAIAHGNLSNYLYQHGEIEESTRHRLAEIVYDIATENTQAFSRDVINMVFHVQHAILESKSYTLPRLKTLLDLAEFRALRFFLNDRETDFNEIQTKVDNMVKKVNEALKIKS